MRGKIVVVWAILMVLSLSSWFYNQIEGAKAWLDQPLTTEVERIAVARGTSLNALLDQWQGDGWVAPVPDLRLLRRLAPELVAIRAGTYDLNSADTPRTVLARLVAGDTVVEFFTLVPGQHIWQLQSQLKNDPRLVQTLPDDLAEWDQSFAFDGWPEGQFLPDTYGFGPGDSDVDVLSRAHEAMSAVLETQWLSRAKDLPLTSAAQALVLASIIEKESGIQDEWRQIAGVFTLRLKKGMRLQTDPTVIYGLLPDFDGDIRRRDLRSPTRWNTYTIDGLPPTPIAMPSPDALRAAVDPLETGHLFFVADGSGGHRFSKTLAEHNANVDRYIRNRQ